MYRYSDFECASCGCVHADLVDVPHGETMPRRAALTCPHCDVETMHDTLISAPAEYLGEKPRSPRVYGGSFDTMGHERMPHLPEVPDGLSSAGVVDFFQRPEYREVTRERAEVGKRNRAKRQRAMALEAHGDVDFRRQKLPGDPQI